MTSLPGLVDNAGCGVPGCRGAGVPGLRGLGVYGKDGVPGSSVQKTGSQGLLKTRGLSFL